MEISEAIYSRRTIKDFKSDPVPADLSNVSSPLACGRKITA